jgi:hypothetical protein
LDFLNPPPGSFDADTMAILQVAFDSAWSKLQVGRGDHPPEQDAELKTTLGERIMAAAKAGETDPVRICRTAIQGLFLSPTEVEPGKPDRRFG